MNFYCIPRQLPELQDLTPEQRRGVMRRFFGERFLIFGGLSGGIGLCVALVVADLLGFSYWPSGVLAVAFYLLGFATFSCYKMNRVRPKITEYVSIHFGQTPA